MKTKLIFIEGIPGSGKTTTAVFIRDHLRKLKHQPILYLENAHYHPVDVDNLSYFTTTEYRKLLSDNNRYKSNITAISEKGINGYFIHYLRWHDLYGDSPPNKLYKQILQCDVHNTFAAGNYLQILKERWTSFAATANKTDEIIIIECSLFQNPMTVLLGKHNLSLKTVKTTIMELVEIVGNLNPALIYLHSDRAQQTIQRVMKLRPQSWMDMVISYVTSQGYGQAHNFEGQKGVFSFYEILQQEMINLAENLWWQKLILNNSSCTWSEYNLIISDFITRILK